jgi:large subunit ribosomal protein L23
MENIVKPLISEKTMRLADELNQYTFIVNPKAGKIAIGKSIAEKYSVKVENVRLLNVLGKKVMFGKTRQKGRRSTYKKAIVTLKKGDSIEVFNIK